MLLSEVKRYWGSFDDDSDSLPDGSFGILFVFAVFDVIDLIIAVLDFSEASS